MPIDIPSKLQTKFWDSVKELPPDKKTEINKVLVNFKKLSDKADDKNLQVQKPKTPKEAEAAQLKFDAEVKNSFEPVGKQIGALQKQLNAIAGDVPKKVADLLKAAASDLATYAKSVDAAVAEARKALETHSAVAAKSAPSSPAAKKAVLTPVQKKLRNEAIRGIKAVRMSASKPLPKPMKAFVGFGALTEEIGGKKTTRTVMRVAMGTAPAKGLLLKSMAPAKGVRALLCDVILENKLPTFVFTGAMPPGGAKALMKGIGEQIGLKTLRLRVRKPDGEVDEIPGGNEPEDDLDAVALDEEDPNEVIDDKVDAATYNERRSELEPRIKAALSGPLAARLQPVVKKMDELAKAGKFEEADDFIDKVEEVLDKLEAAASPVAAKSAASASSNTESPVAAKSASGATAPTAGSAPAQKQIGDAMLQLSRAIQAVQKGIEDFRRAMQAEYGNGAAPESVLKSANDRLTKASQDCAALEVQKAMAAAMQKRGPADIAAAKKSLDDFLANLTKHEIIKDLDGNELVPMNVVGELRRSVQTAKSALG